VRRVKAEKPAQRVDAEQASDVVELVRLDGIEATQSTGKEQSNNYAERRWQRIDATMAALHEWFPVAFALDRPPLKIGIHHDLAERAAAITPKEVREALRFHTGTLTYLRGLIEGAPRLDLDGEPAGAVTAAEAAHAGIKLARIKERSRERKAAAEPPPPAAVAKPPPAPAGPVIVRLKRHRGGGRS